MLDVFTEIYMPIATGDQWKMIVGRFKIIWNLSNYIGALSHPNREISKYSILKFQPQVPFCCFNDD